MSFTSVVEKHFTRVYEPKIKEVFRQVALGLFARINSGDFRFENDTYNLSASIGAGVFIDGVLTDWTENPSVATTPKEVTYKGKKTIINGADLLNTALGEVEVKDMGKYVMIVLAAAPYGIAVDMPHFFVKRGEGWWSEDVVPKLIEQFRMNARAL